MKKSILYELTRMALIPYYSRDPETNDCWITALVYGKVQLVAQHMIQLLPDSRWIVYQGRIVFLISLVDSSCKIIAEDKRFLEFLQVNGLTASLSNCFSHLTFLRKYYKQCLTAVEIDFQLNSNKPVYMYEDYLCEHIGRIISEQNDLADFCHPVIQKLIAYDNGHKTSLLPTLEAYLQYVDTPNLAAKTLFIHRNTLFYRINRIRELFEVDLSDGDIRLKLQMTLHFLKLKTQRGDPEDQR
ncbi:helix-turn-helix domain-containing protein [Paenibacillus sp. CMM36]